MEYDRKFKAELATALAIAITAQDKSIPENDAEAQINEYLRPYDEDAQLRIADMVDDFIYCGRKP